MDVGRCTARFARGEVYDTAKRARSPCRGGVVVSYSSGELGTVDYPVCARRCTRLVTRAQPVHIPPTCLI